MNSSVPDVRRAVMSPDGLVRRLYLALGIDSKRFDAWVVPLLRPDAAGEGDGRGEARAPDARDFDARLRAAIRAAGLARLGIFDPLGPEDGRQRRELAYRVAVVRAILAGSAFDPPHVDRVGESFAHPGPWADPGRGVLDRARLCVERAWNAQRGPASPLGAHGIECWVEFSRRLVAARIWHAGDRTGRIWPTTDSAWLLWPLAGRDLMRESGAAGTTDDLAAELAGLGLIRARASEPVPGAAFWCVAAVGRRRAFKAVAWEWPERWPDYRSWPRATVAARAWTPADEYAGGLGAA